MSMKDAWNAISTSYQDRYQISTKDYYYGPFCPDEEQLQLLGPVKNKHILELGAGAGQNSIYLASLGAIATAYDISIKQLEYGQELARAAGVKVEFIEGSFEDFPGQFEAASFDLVVSSFAFQYHQTTESLTTTFNEIERVLAPGGRAVISVDHPVKAIGAWNEGGEFVLRRYFDNETKVWDYAFPESGVTAEMRGRYFTITEYLNCLLASGLILQSVLEPLAVKTDASPSNFGRRSVYGIDSKQDPFNFEHLKKIPGTLIMQAVKKA